MDKTGYQKYQLGQAKKARQIRYTLGEARDGQIKSPMPGRITQILVNKEDHVKKGQLLMIIEAMKMENEIFAPMDGVIREVNVSTGQTVHAKDILLGIDGEEER